MDIKAVNAGTKVLLKDIKNDTFFVNTTLKLFMIKDNDKFLINDVQNKKNYLSTLHSDSDECLVCTENYREFAYQCEVERMKLLESNKVPDSRFYGEHGIAAIPVSGSCWFTSTATVYKVLDGVQYIFDATDAHGEYVHAKVSDLIECFDIIHLNYHQQIKEVVHYLQKNDQIGDVWVLISGHTVYHQLFIGNSTGYICSMWFGDKHPINTVNCSVEWQKNNIYFEGFKSTLNVKIKESTS